MKVFSQRFWCCLGWGWAKNNKIVVSEEDASWTFQGFARQKVRVKQRDAPQRHNMTEMARKFRVVFGVIFCTGSGPFV